MKSVEAETLGKAPDLETLIRLARVHVKAGCEPLKETAAATRPINRLQLPLLPDTGGPRCYCFGGNGHFARECATVRQCFKKTNDRTENRDLRQISGCFNCGQSGHIASKCQQRKTDPTEFDGRSWTAAWKWKSGEAPSESLGGAAAYASVKQHEKEVSQELAEWKKNGWLIPFKDTAKAILPLMAEVQTTKGKVRPVLDYRALNEFVSSHTAESLVCAEKLLKGCNI